MTCVKASTYFSNRILVTVKVPQQILEQEITATKLTEFTQRKLHFDQSQTSV